VQPTWSALQPERCSRSDAAGITLTLTSCLIVLVVALSLGHLLRGGPEIPPAGGRVSATLSQLIGA
jgi:hypothetical protein